MADKQTQVMVRSGSFPGKLPAGRVGEVVCLGDAHFFLLALPRERVEV